MVHVQLTRGSLAEGISHSQAELDCKGVRARIPA
ncbi:hypothetical protein CSUI_009730, partial [Cystoisospora suis]